MSAHCKHHHHGPHHHHDHTNDSTTHGGSGGEHTIASPNKSFVLRLAWVGILMSIGLCISNIFLYRYSHAHLVYITILDTAMDIATSIFNLWLIYVSYGSADTNHTYGHGKAQSLGAITQITVLVTLLCQVNIETMQSLYTQWITGIHVLPRLSITTLICFAVCATVAFTVGYAFVHYGKRYKSVALQSDGLHYMSDGLLNLGTVGTVCVLHFFPIFWLDGVVSIVFSIKIIIASIQAFRLSMVELMDENTLHEEFDFLQESLLDIDSQIEQVSSLRCRQIGETYFFDVGVVLKNNLTILESSVIKNGIDQLLTKRFHTIDLTVNFTVVGADSRI
jgi:ferrous-iron efflux pump FieF